MVATNGLVCIDLSDFENRKIEIAKQLMHAGTEVGFFYVSLQRLSWARFLRNHCQNSEQNLIAGTDLQSRHPSRRY